MDTVDYKNLPDSLEAEELEIYFNEFLRNYADKPKDIDALNQLYELAYRQWDTYEKLDKSYILSVKKEPFAYVCFTNEKQFYAENYPDLVIENGNIDDLILMMTGGR